MIDKVKLTFCVYLMSFMNSECQGNVDSSDKVVPQWKKRQCWISIDVDEHFKAMHVLDERYADVRSSYQDAADASNFDKKMYETLMKSRGLAERELQNYQGASNVVPAGLNLGGYSMMRLPGSILFFHRMKLRNNTVFRVNELHNDLKMMTLTARLSLNDLHLVGNYERALTDTDDPSILFYRPTYGQIEFLLKDVKYKMEGRYRLLSDRLVIEHVLSELEPAEILMTYTSDKNFETTKLEKNNLDEYLLRMKNDLDSWLKDYFNDYLMYFGFEGTSANDKFVKYDKEKTTALTEYSDVIIQKLANKIHRMGMQTVTIPTFKLVTSNGMRLILKDGIISGFDTMYRRSVATGNQQRHQRNLDVEVAFSNLKVEYKYEAELNNYLPPLMGGLMLSADDLTTHMTLGLVKDSETVDLQFKFLRYSTPESLTVEGPANRVIGNFRHLLEHHIISIMSSSLIHQIQMLNTLSRCVPALVPNEEPIEPQSEPDIANTTPFDTPADKETGVSTDDNLNPEISKTDNPTDANLPQENVTDQNNDLNEADKDVQEDANNNAENDLGANEKDGDNANIENEMNAENNPDSNDNKETTDNVKVVTVPAQENEFEVVSPGPKGDNKNVLNYQGNKVNSASSEDSNRKGKENNDGDIGAAKKKRNYYNEKLKLNDQDYVLTRHSSAEIELPLEAGAEKNKIMLLKHNEKYTLSKLPSE